MIVDLFSFRGRASRAEFWIVHMVAVTLQIVAVFYLMVHSPAFAKFLDHGSVSLSALTVRNIIDSITINRYTLLTIFLAPMVILVAVAVRRAHDRDKTGWWVLAMLLPVFISLFLGDIRPDMVRPNEIDVLAVMSAAWYFSDLGVLDGSPGANSYAPKRSAVETGMAMMDDPPLESQRAHRNAEAAMDRAIAERRGVAADGTGTDRRRGLPDTRENKVERRQGGDRRQAAGQQGFGRRA